MAIDLGELEQQYGLPDGLLSAVQKQESGGDANAVSPKGAAGAFQFMPATAKQYGIDPTDPDQSAVGAARMYSDLSKKYNGDVPSMLAAYNWGQGNVDKHGIENAPQETQDYIQKITSKLPKGGTQYAQADTGNMTDAGDYKSIQDSNADIETMSLPEALAEQQRLQGSSQPSNNADIDNMSLAELNVVRDNLQGNQSQQSQGIASRIVNDVSSNLQQGADILAKQFTDQAINPATAGAQVLGSALGAAYSPVAEVGKNTYSALPNAVTQPINAAAQSAMQGAGSLYQQGVGNLAETSIGQSIGDYLMNSPNAQNAMQGTLDLAKAAGNVALAAPAGELAGVAQEAVTPAASDIISRLKASELGVGDLAKDTSSGVSYGTPAVAKIPPIAPQTAQLVKDAQDLGINIPARTFAPGLVSGALGKVGLMGGDTMQADVTSALSRVMGHEGTPNLDVDTMNGIQQSIGNRMNDFASKADAKGGIPIATDSLQKIADDSLADEPQINKVLKRIQDRMDENGNLSGDDYKALTQKGSVLDKALHSSDSALADSAQELRDYLDSQLGNTVDPSDLADFQKARQQYRTMKIIQPIVESGGVSGQPDSATKLFNAVVGKRGYGSLQNALEYNPKLGKIAQIVNEFPEAVKPTEQAGAIAKVAKLASAPAALGIGAVGGVPAGIAAGATLPFAYGIGKYLSSPAYRASLIERSLPKILSEAEQVTPKPSSPLLALPEPSPYIVSPKGVVKTGNPLSDIPITEINNLPPDIRSAQLGMPTENTPPVQNWSVQSNPERMSLSMASEGSRPVSAYTFLKRNGGLQDEFGDVADLGHKDLINKSKGMPLDTAREKLVEQGYLPQDADTNSVLDMLSNSNGGRKATAIQDVGSALNAQDSALAKFRNDPTYIAQQAHSIGIDTVGKTPGQLKSELVAYYTAQQPEPIDLGNEIPFKKGGVVRNRSIHLSKKLELKLGREPKATETELAEYVGAHGVHRLLNQKDVTMPAHKMFPQAIVVKHKELFFNKKKPYTVAHIKGVL